MYVGRSNCNRCWEGQVLNITTQVSSRLWHNSLAYILLLGPVLWVVYILDYVIFEAVIEMSSWRNWGTEKWSILLTGSQLVEWSVGTEIWSLVGTKTLNSLVDLRHWSFWGRWDQETLYTTHQLCSGQAKLLWLSSRLRMCVKSLSFWPERYL